MAINVLKDGMYVNAITNNDNLVTDIGNYIKGETAFREYADAAYDSSKDYWRVTLDENGKIAKVQDDGDKDHITIVSASGEKTVIDRDNSITLSHQMAQINGDTSEAGKTAMNTLMWKKGLNYTDEKGWHARNEDGVYTETYLDYAYPGIQQKIASEQSRQREAANFAMEQEKQKAVDETSGMWPNFLSGSYDGLYMGDFGSNVKAGNTELLLDRIGCHFLATNRAGGKLGKNIDILSAAANTAYFDSKGNLQSAFFTNNGINAYMVEGRTAINNKLQELKTFDKPFVLIGAAKFGNGYHSVSITNVYVAPNGGFEVTTQETSRNGINQGRTYGLQNSRRENYYHIERLYYLY